VGRYLEAVAPRTRILAFGSTALLVVAGVACGVLVGGLTGQVLLIALILLGLGGALLLLFLEVGLSEDRERERDERRRREAAVSAQRLDAPRWPRLPRRPRRPG
jgi:hypothetical protein